MTSDPSGWRTVDPHAGSMDFVPPDPPSAGETVVFSVDASDEDRDWAVHTVAAVIREWSGSVDRLFVMDLDLQGSGIEDVLDARRAEGVSDLLLFGASLSRVVQNLGDGGFHFVPVGTPVANPRRLLSHGHWDDVVRSFGEAGAVLVLYLPAQPGAASLLSRADRIVRLGRPGEGEGQIPVGVFDRLAVSLAPPDADLVSVEPAGSAGMEESDRETREEARDGDGFRDLEVGIGDGDGGFQDAAEVGEVPATEVGSRERGDVVEIADLAPDEPSVEVGAGASGQGMAAAGEAAPEDSPARGVEARWPGPVVDIRDLAPDREVVDIEDLAPDEPVEASASMGRAGPVVDIADLAPDEPVVDIEDLAPDEPVGLARSPTEGAGISEDQPGAEEAYSEFPEEPSPEAETDDEVVPSAPETEEVEETTVPTGGKDFEEESFVAGLDAIDEAAKAGGQEGLANFDLDDLDALGSESMKESGDHDREAEEELPAGAEGELSGGEMELEREPLKGESLEEEPFEEATFGEASDADASFEEDSADAEGTEDDLLVASDELVTGSEGLTGAGRGPGEAEDEALEGEMAGEAEDDDGDALEFGGFSGELDMVEEEPEVDDEAVAEAGRDPDAGVGDVEAEMGGTDTDDDFGADLVTGPDFGHTSAEEEEIWGDGPDDQEAGTEEETSAEAGAGARGGAAGDGSPPTENAQEAGEPGGGEGPNAEPPLVGVDTGGSRDRTQGRPLRLLALLVLLAAGAATAHWYDVIDVPGLDRALATVLGPARTGAAPSVETGGTQPTSPILTRSLLVDVYRDAQSAAEVALALRERLPDRIFAVVPVQASGDVTYQLLAGPASTVEEATALRGTLAGVLTREDPSQWTPRETSLAFVIDEVEGLDVARARADAVTSDRVFAYVLRVTYPDGSTAHRIYAGGYADAEEARALQGILSQVGIDATFTERRGEIPE